MCGSFLSRCHTSLWDSLISHRLWLLNIQCVPVLEVPLWIEQGLMVVWSKRLLDHESLAWRNHLEEHRESKRAFALGSTW